MNKEDNTCHTLTFKHKKMISNKIDDILKYSALFLK